MHVKNKRKILIRINIINKIIVNWTVINNVGTFCLMYKGVEIKGAVTHYLISKFKPDRFFFKFIKMVLYVVRKYDACEMLTHYF